MLLRYPDGTLASVCRSQLVGAVVDAARDTRPDGLLDVLDLPVLGWTLPAEVAATLNAERGAAFTGHSPDDIDYVVGVDRARQLAAIAAHASQALSTDQRGLTKYGRGVPKVGLPDVAAPPAAGGDNCHIAHCQAG